MKKSNLFRNVIAISVSFGVMVLFGTNSSKAVLQSNGNGGAAYNLNYWMMNVRKMEELGGAMGLSETVDSNLTSSNGSNNIDVHMEKNTEYGALAILSASSYGNPNKINDGETTTGNATGVVMKINKEWVASTIDNEHDAFKGYAGRYKNIYNASYSAKIGDAMTETLKWHGSEIYWQTNYDASLGIVRAYSNGIFSYWSTYNYDSYNGIFGGSAIQAKYGSRAVIVQGDGI